MSHPELDTFSISLSEEDLKNPEKMDAFQEAMNASMDAMSEYTDSLAQKLGVTDGCALDIVYLRSRSRWTQRMEDELIRLHKAGTPPNVFDWPEQNSPLRD